MEKAYEKTLKFIEKNLNKEREKYRDGRKHNLFEWEDLLSDFENMYKEVNTPNPLIKTLDNEVKRLKGILSRYGLNG